MPGNKNCPVCGSPEVREVLLIKEVPANCCILWEDPRKAVRCPRGDIRLCFCERCGHLYNQDFNEHLMSYREDYDNSLHFSPKFQQYSTSLIRRLTETYRLYNKNILEIGCGKGDFLQMICEYGQNRGYGFDKSYQPELDPEPQMNGVKYIKDYYSEKYADYPADFIVTRFVLEHIPEPHHFLSNIKQIAHLKNPKAQVYFFEVPNILYTLRDLGIWDLIYEHCNHFTASSLTQLFERSGFRVMNVEENYMGQFLSIEASTWNHSPAISYSDRATEGIKSFVDRFAGVFHQKTGEWKQKLKHFKDQGQKAVIWGGGAKGFSFLNFLETNEVIQYVVDINPRKRGKYIAGTGQEYVLPEDLKKINPHAIIIMNPIYTGEITHKLSELGITPELFTA